jgi:carbon monoxide dehydrogenase subunit G
MVWLVRGLTAIVLVLAVYAVWALTAGGKVENHTRVEISQPPDVVFGYLIEPDRIRLWMDGYVESRSLTGPGTFVGARSTEVIEVNGERTEMDLRVTEFEQDALLAVRIKSDQVEARNRYQLSKTASGTRIDYDSQTEARGWVRLLAPVLHDAIQEKIDADFARLKQTLEDRS